MSMNVPATMIVEAAETAQLYQRIDELEGKLAALQTDMAMYRQALDSVSDMVLCKGEHSHIVYANRAFREFYNMSETDIQGLIDAPFAKPDNTLQYIKDDEYVFTTGQTLVIPEEPVTRHDGEVHLFHTVKSASRDMHGQIAYTIGVSWDITERQRASAILHQNVIQEEMIHAQQVALEELSTPLLAISDDVIVMPLVGSIDSARAQAVLDTLLEGVAAHSTHVAIIDITGVPIVDTGVANGLVRAAQAAQLLGAQVVLTGIRPEVAQTLVGLGVELRNIVTQATLQSGIAFALRMNAREGRGATRSVGK